MEEDDEDETYHRSASTGDASPGDDGGPDRTPRTSRTPVLGVKKKVVAKSILRRNHVDNSTTPPSSAASSAGEAEGAAEGAAEGKAEGKAATRAALVWGGVENEWWAEEGFGTIVMWSQNTCEECGHDILDEQILESWAQEVRQYEEEEGSGGGGGGNGRREREEDGRENGWGY